ncbi:hypothetical protein JCM8547_007912 [Rhodosporidiobolus lusitaniae]
MPTTISLQEAHAILGTSTGDSLDTVKSAYRKLALTHHPDKNKGSEESTEKFKSVTAAWERIADPPKEPALGIGGGGAGFGGMPPGFVFSFGGGGTFFSFGGGGGGFYSGGMGGRGGYYDDDDEDYEDQEYDDDYPDEDEYDEESDDDYDDFARFAFEDILRGGYGTRSSYHSYRQHEKQHHETDAECAARMKAEAKRMRKAEERRKREAAWVKEQREKEKEEESRRAASRRSAKRAAQSASRDAAASQAAAAALKRLQLAQLKRSAVFAALRTGDVERAKKGVFEDSVDPAGGEFLEGGLEAVEELSTEEREVLEKEIEEERRKKGGNAGGGAGGAAKKGAKKKGKKGRTSEKEAEEDAIWASLGAGKESKPASKQQQKTPPTPLSSKKAAAASRPPPAYTAKPAASGDDDDDLPPLVDSTGDAPLSSAAAAASAQAEADGEMSKSKLRRMKKKAAAAKKAGPSAATSGGAGADDDEDDLPDLVDASVPVSSRDKAEVPPSPTLVAEEDVPGAGAGASGKKKNKKKKKGDASTAPAAEETKEEKEAPVTPPNAKVDSAPPSPEFSKSAPFSPNQAKSTPPTSVPSSPDVRKSGKEKETSDSPESPQMYHQQLQNDPKETLLHIAAKLCNAALIEWLVAHGANPEERDSSRSTAFHASLLLVHVPSLRYFLDSSPPPFPAPPASSFTSGNSPPDAYYPLPRGQHSLLSLSLTGAGKKGPQKTLEAVECVLPYATGHDLQAAWKKVEYEEKKVRGNKEERERKREGWEEVKWKVAERAKELDYEGFTPPEEYLRRRRLVVV